MQNNLESIILILEQLKEIKIPTSTVEKELGFSNGLLKKGKLSNEKWERLVEYYENKVMIFPPKKDYKKHKNESSGLKFAGFFTPKSLDESNEQKKWVSEIEEICNQEEITPDELVKQWKEMKNSVTLSGLRKGLNSKIKDSDLIKVAENSKKNIKKVNPDFQNETFILPKKNVEIHSNPGLSKWQLELRKKKLGI